MQFRVRDICDSRCLVFYVVLIQETVSDDVSEEQAVAFLKELFDSICILFDIYT